ncbi:semaphorin-4A-like [Sinocyclocheilus anshuiensis]|uniref:semaphorin-4A-like n=1 Tax=Sinocyclocheilus anshuiensis TaxID=1608454 RepID=UPI0007B9EABA|nr:PREDICTED: semaphorin-4A-like [Sinocyclocheilus anshuiensis]
MVHSVSLCACLSLLTVLSCHSHVLPRLSFPMGSPGRSLNIFTNPDVYNTTTLLLSNDEGTLFIGARDSVLSIDVSQTDAMAMKEKLDWSPSEKDLADCAMKGKMKMDCHNFVRVLQVLNSTHMYACGTFAFSPRCIYINSKTFSVATGPSGKPEEGRGRCPYDPYQKNTAITDIVSLTPPEGASEDQTLFYGIFTSQWQVNLGRSAVCAFSLKDIKKVFTGRYKVLNRDTLKWSTRVQEQMANPGECGLHNASDNTLRFVKDNFLADKSVRPVIQGLTLVSPDKSYSNIAVQRVRGARGRDYTLLYLLTESGFLHKAVLLENGAHIIEEIQVFHQPQPVKNLLLSVSKGAVLIGSSEGVVSVPMSNCSYYLSCAECVLARDPFCGWDPVMKLCTDIHSHDHLVQDVDEGNVSAQCTYVTPRSRSGQSRTPSSEVVSVSLNEVVHLQCPGASHLAKRHWERLNSQLPPKIYIQSDDGSLSFVATPSTLGHYLCQAVENGYSQTLVVYHVKQKSNPTILPATPNRPYSTPSTEAGIKTPVSTTRLITPEQTEPRPKPDEVHPTVTLKDSPVATTRKSRNFTPLLGTEKEDSRMTEPGENLQQADKPSYFQELVVVSILLALCVSALLTIALNRFRHLCRSRTVPQTPSSRRDTEKGGSATPQERESLRGNSPRLEKQNGQAPNGQSHNGQAHNGKSPITLSNSMLNNSNGHLPNTPI